MSDDNYAPSGYRVDGKDLEAILGPLEADVLNAVYDMGKPVRVREVYERMKGERKIAYTTVMSTMNTLHEKGILDRKVTEGRGGLLYVYWTKMTREEIEKSAVKHIMDSLMKNFGEAVTSYLVDMDNTNKRKDLVKGA
jgi:predicted transcriptional regulator